MNACLCTARYLLVKAVNLFLLLIVVLSCAGQQNIATGYAGKNWAAFAGDDSKSRYSTLTGINKQNVKELRPVWSYRSGDFSEDTKTSMQCNPLVMDGIVYGTTAALKLVALDGATGKEIWRFDPLSLPVIQELRVQEGIKIVPGVGYWVNRGVLWWQKGSDRRVYHSCGPYLFALNAATGTFVTSFGNGGMIDMRQGLGRDVKGLHYNSTTPGVVYKNYLIMGSTVSEGPTPAAPGFVRAFDIQTGKLAWVFHTIPQGGEFGTDTWKDESWKTAGGANAWSGISLDQKRGMVFLATGSPAWDFYGGDRKGDNLFGNCVIALDAQSGKRIWHFQTVHHDLWDKDVPCAPNLVTVMHNGKKRDAVAQVSKTGYLYLFDRETGVPLFDIKETPVQSSDIAGEQTAPTQPIPVKPLPFARTSFSEKDVTNLDSGARAYAMEVFRKSKSGPAFTPLGEQMTFIMPGLLGGATWSGASYDPTTGLLYVNSNDLPSLYQLIKSDSGSRYPVKLTGPNRFWDTRAYPFISPPWGQLTAINLNTGEFAWQKVLGEFDELTAKGIPPTGAPNLGGSIVTAGGLVFIASTQDEKFRAFDKGTGEVLWETKLPVAGYATPSTYMLNGRQYIVIAAGGGGKMLTKSGDYYIAFALP
ncbi:MAG: pyrroloquinoline quinone-dependent dehydrogenase [Chitinophagaceae bacterium]|nr:pyrroloquinoline quinone-dependent dehydrogenase [Chitinophagaceae bacterium]